jgi:hypothetical protein
VETRRETDHLDPREVAERDRRAVVGKARMAEKKALDREAAKEQPETATKGRQGEERRFFDQLTRG